MLSPQKSAVGGLSPRTAVPLRGLFLDGVWRCNCPERPPAVKLQTKNHGVNHGRWFYTCQKPQNKRCNFFLWHSDAEAREKHTVLANSRSEPGSAAATPTKVQPQRFANGLPTPQTDVKDGPRKAARTETYASPGKRKLSEMEDERGGSFVSMTPTLVSSPRTGTGMGTGLELGAGSRLPPPSSAEISMTPTPTPGRFRNVLEADVGGDSSKLALQALKILEAHKVVVPKQAQDELMGLLNRQDLKMKGISRGRDISRIALKKKDETIMRLNERIASLESQREMDRAVIDGLRGR
ncbi:uncharacterized protein ACLA_035960 [Aspergillus clavatus NRRL 1]|uniref:GRF-type domain-containing protein n=1 Tax=Aspergillus clavatus (strain ATCC 1007 / CBS 513.65 / DSM 816 / NCTC 3887 / NRRL 1 / QM 1276 / 107) TaxID=344612 RepID=A1CJR9_ASPCL|nr:uncharacterized protein ACLA_035960 [Aspergillus clavatus NRRL 1]EAW09393.1 hypothetical protein ACLA_035960 [Aspergillus clavatus NRRL 1]